MMRNLMCAAASALFLVAPATAQVYRIMLDPGHGGSDPGTGPGWDPAPPCYEKDMVLNACKSASVYLGALPGFDTRMTRSDDTNPDPGHVAWRRALANAWPAHAFVPVHINACNPPGPPYACSACPNDDCKTYYWAGTSSDLAADLAWTIPATYGSDYGGYHIADPARMSVLEGLVMPGAYLETDFICQTKAHQLCDRYSDETLDFGWGMREAMCSYFGGPQCSYAIGTSFAAVPGSQQVTLYWEDTDPGTTYTIRRADSCWGPYVTVLATVPWNSSGTYSYVDATMLYEREYSYEIEVSPSGERVTADATPWGLSSPIQPGPPSNLMASTEYESGPTGTAMLTWAAASGGYGFVGYNVFRSSTGSMANCHAVSKTLVGTTSALTMLDPEVAIGDTYYYRVVAFDTEGHSEPSNEVVVSMLGTITDVPVNPIAPDLRLGVEREGAGRVKLTIETGVPEVVRVEVFDVAGRRVAEPLHDVTVEHSRTYTWRGVDEDGRAVGAGIYFVRAVTKSGFERRAKVVLLR